MLIVLAVRRLLRAGEQARIRGLVLLLTVTVLFFSYADEAVAELPDQFVSLTHQDRRPVLQHQHASDRRVR